MFKRSNLCKQGLALAYSITVVTSLNFIGEAFAKSEQEIKESATITDHRPYAKDAIDYYNAALELHQQGFINEAVAKYKAAIEADDRMEEAYMNLSVIYAALHKYNEALALFQRMVVVMPNRARGFDGLGSALYGLGRVDEAIPQWRRAIELDPKYTPTYAHLANALEKTGHKDEAKKVLESEPKD
jgi:tetratricopeptide (TPR) repeat protein